MSDVDTDIVVVNYHTYDLLDQFLKSYYDFEPFCETSLTVIDVDGDPQQFEMIQAPGAMLIGTDINIGYARACNMAASSRAGRNIAFFNADTRFVDNECVDYCTTFLDFHPEVAVVGPLQYDSSRNVTAGGLVGSFDDLQDRWFRQQVGQQHRTNEKVSSVSGSAYFVKRSVWDELTECPTYYHLHPFANGAFLPTQHYYEETACSYHAQAHGHEVWFLGEAEMIHEWHKSSPLGGPMDRSSVVEASKRAFQELVAAHD